MEMRPPNAARTVSFAFLFASLLVAAAMLGLLLAIALTHAQSAEEPEVRQLLVVVAWTSLVLLSVDMVLLLWAAARLISRRYTWPQRPEGRSRLGHPPTPYVDAWAEAGRRLQVDEDEDEQEQGEDEQEDSGGD